MPAAHSCISCSICNCTRTGTILRGAMLLDRKQALKQLLLDAPDGLRYSDHFDVPGRDFSVNVCKLGLEGMISKRAEGRFEAGRSPAWLKVEVRATTGIRDWGMERSRGQPVWFRRPAPGCL